MQSLGLSRLILTSPLLVDNCKKKAQLTVQCFNKSLRSVESQNYISHLNDELVDIDKMMELVDAFYAGCVVLFLCSLSLPDSSLLSSVRQALDSDQKNSILKLKERVDFFVQRRQNAQVWHQTVITKLSGMHRHICCFLIHLVSSPPPAPTTNADASSTPAPALLLGLALADLRQLRSLLFYRRCQFGPALLRALLQRVEQTSNKSSGGGGGGGGSNSTHNDETAALAQEFWAMLSSLRGCCAESGDGERDESLVSIALPSEFSQNGRLLLQACLKKSRKKKLRKTALSDQH